MRTAPTRPGARALRLLALSAVAAAVAPARADTSNFRPYLVGGRAAGMGGAFTALADDGAGPWYNPAGIGFVERSQIALSGSAYGLVSGSFADALGDGRTFRYRKVDSFPSSTTGIWRLPDPAPDRAQALSVGVYLPDGFSADDRDRLGSPQNAFLFTSEQQTLWFNASWARRFGDLSVGVGLYGLLRTALDAFDLTLMDPADSSRFATITPRVDSTSYGAAAAAGVRWDPAPGLHLGLAATSPALGTGSRRVYARVAASAPPAAPAIAVTNEDRLHAAPTEPARLQAGVAWTSGPLAVTADVTWRLPRTVTDDPGRAAEGLSRTVKQIGTLDAAVGLEVLVARRFPLRAGLFTDRASSPGRAGVVNSGRIDRYGISASGGLATEHTSSSIGLNLSQGTGRDVVPDNLDFSRLKTTRATQRLLYVFLSTAYAF
jgi:long-chain fatty acid transport protein